MEAHPYEQLDYGVPPSIEEARRTFVGDFYASFKFSQGAADVQNALYPLLATTYSKLWTPEGMEQVAPQALAAAEPLAQDITPPTQHPRMTPDKIAAEASKQWNLFSEQVQKQATSTPMTNLQFHVKSMVLRRGIPLWDMRQVTLGRFNRKTDEATRESLYRKHVLDGQTTRSQAFDIIFASMRRHQLRHTPNIGLVYLKAGWELHHKDETFYPENYRADLKNGPLYARALHVSPLVMTTGIVCKGLLLLSSRLRKPRDFQQNN